MKVRLTRIESNHNNLRTPTIEGDTPKLPAVGEDFQMFAPPLVAGDVRVLRTTAVLTVDETGFTTRNSKYRLEVLNDETAPATQAQG